MIFELESRLTPGTEIILTSRNVFEKMEHVAQKEVLEGFGLYTSFRPRCPKKRVWGFA